MAAKKVNTMDFKINFDIVSKAKGELDEYAKKLREIQDLSSGRLGSKVADGMLTEVNKQVKQLDVLMRKLTSPKLTKGEKLKLIDITDKDLAGFKTMMKNASTFWNTEIKKSAEAQKKLDELLAKRKELTTLKGKITKNNNKMSGAEQALAEMGYTGGTTTKDKAGLDSKVRNLKKDIKNEKNPERIKELQTELDLTEKLAVELQKIIDARKAGSELNKQLKSLSAINGMAGTTDPTVATKRFDKEISAKVIETEDLSLIEKFNALFLSLSELPNKAGSAFEDFSTVMRGSLEASYADMEQFEETAASVKQVLASFGIGFSAYQIANYFKQLVTEALNFYRSLDAALTEIRVVSNLTAETVANLKNEFITMSKESGMAIDDITKAAVLFFQQGLNTDEVLEMTEVTAQFAKVAGVDATKAADQLTAAVNGYCLAAEDASLVADKFNKVAAASAADINELSTAFSKAAAQANQAGVSMDNYLAYIATMEEATREAPENIGTSLKTIFSRMQQVKKSGSTEDGDTDVNQVETALKSVGVALRDSENQLRDLEDVLDELGAKWNSLDINTQAYLGTIIAGTRQQSRFITLMQNWDRVIQLSEESQNSAGQQALMHQKSMESLNTAIQQLSNAWETFISNLTESDAIKNIVKFLTSLVNLVNKGKTPIAMLGVAITLLSKNFGKLGGTLKVTYNNLKGFVKNTKNLKVNGMSKSFSGWATNLSEVSKSYEEVRKKIAENEEQIAEYDAELADLRIHEKDNAQKIQNTTEQKQKLEAQNKKLAISEKELSTKVNEASAAYQQMGTALQITQSLAMLLVTSVTTLVSVFGMADTTSGQAAIGIASIAGAIAIAIVAYKVLAATVKMKSAEMAAAMSSTGVGAILVAIGMAVGGLITLFSALATSSETAAKNMNESIESIGDKLEDIASAATAITQVERLLKKYDELTNKVYRTAQEQQELNDTIQALGDTYDIETMTDKYGNLSINISEVTEKLEEEREELAKLNDELDKAEKDGYKKNDFQAIEYYENLFSKHRSDYKKLLPGADDFDIDTSKLKASAQEIETLETNLKNAILDSAEEQAYWLGKQKKTISDYIVGLNEELNDAMDDDAWSKYYTMMGEFGDQVDDLNYADMQKKLDEFFKNFQKQCGLTTEQVKLLRQAMNDTLYSDSSLDETINSLKDSIDKEQLLLDKQKEIDQEYKLHWYNWLATITLMGGIFGPFVEKQWGVIGKTIQKNQALLDAANNIGGLDTSTTEELIQSLERLTAASGTALDAIGAYKDLIDEEGNVLLTAQEFLEGLNIDAINQAFKDGGNGAGYEEIIRQLARQIENTDDKELKDALQKKLNDAVGKLEITAEFSWKTLGTELETITTDLRSMNEIMEEFNENGGISLDTFMELCELLDKIDMETLFQTGMLDDYIGLLDKLNLGFDESTGYITAEADSMETLQNIQQVLAKTQLLATIQKLKNTKAGLEAELDMVAVEKSATKTAIEYLKQKGQGTVKLSEIESAANVTYQKGMDAAMKKATDVYKAMTADSKTWAMATIQNAKAVNEAINKAYTSDFSADSLEKTLQNISSNMKWEGLSASGIYSISDGDNVDVQGAIAQLEEYSTKLDNTSSDIEARIKKIDAMIIGLNKLVNSDLGNLGAEAEDVEKYIGQLEEIYNLLRKIEGVQNRLSHLEDYQDLSRGSDYAGYLQERIKLTNNLTSSYKKLLAEQKYIENTEQAAIKGSPVGHVFSFDEFGNIIIDYKEYIKLSDKHKELADELYEEYQDIHETTNDYYEDLIENINKSLEAQQQLVDTYVDLENDLADAVKDIYQDMLDNKLEAIDKEIEALDKLREARDRANQSKQDSKELSNLQTSLKRSMMDTSGASNTKVLDYQDQIQAKLEQMGEDEYTRRLDSITEALEAEKEQLQRNFDEFFEDWTTFHDMIETRILPNEQAVLEVLKTTDAYLQAGDAERAQMVDEWMTNYKTAMTAVQDGGTIMDVVNSIIELKDTIPDIDTLLQNKDYWEEVGTGFSRALIEWFEKQKNGDGSGNKTNNNPGANGGNVTSNDKPKTSTDAPIKNYDDIIGERGSGGTKPDPAIKSWWDELMTSIGEFFTKTIPNFFASIPGLWDKYIAPWFTAEKWDELMNNISTAIHDFITGIPDKLVELGQGLVTGIGNIWNGITSFLGNAWNSLWNLLPSSIQEKISSVWSSFYSTIEPLVQSIKDLFTSVWDAIKLVWDTVSPYFVGIWEYIKSVFAVAGDFISGIFSVVWEVIKTGFSLVFEKLKLIWNNIKTIFKAGVDIIGSLFSNVWEVIKAVWNNIVDVITTAISIVTAIIDTFVGLFSGDMDKVKEAWSKVWSNLKDLFIGIWDTIKTTFKGLVDFFKDTGISIWNAITGVFKNIGNFFKNVWEDIKNGFSAIGTKVSDTFSNAIRAGLNGLMGSFEGIVNTFINMINGAINAINAIPGVDIKKLTKVEFKRFKKGGMADFTGPAWLDGTKSAPEAVLNAAQTKAFMKLADNLDKFDTDSMGGNIHIESIEFRVDSMSSVADGEKAFDAFVNRFKEIGRQTGLTMNTARLK